MKHRTFDWARRAFGLSSPVFFVSLFTVMNNFGGRGQQNAAETIAGYIVLPALIVMLGSFGVLIFDLVTDKRP